MQETVIGTSKVLAKAWFVKYSLDMIYRGPYCFDNFVYADVAISLAKKDFGELPVAVAPDGKTQVVRKYQFELAR